MDAAYGDVKRKAVGPPGTIGVSVPIEAEGKGLFGSLSISVSGKKDTKKSKGSKKTKKGDKKKGGEKKKGGSSSSSSSSSDSDEEGKKSPKKVTATITSTPSKSTETKTSGGKEWTGSKNFGKDKSFTVSIQRLPDVKGELQFKVKGKLVGKLVCSGIKMMLSQAGGDLRASKQMTKFKQVKLKSGLKGPEEELVLSYPLPATLGESAKVPHKLNMDFVFKGIGNSNLRVTCEPIDLHA